MVAVLHGQQQAGASKLHRSVFETSHSTIRSPAILQDGNCDSFRLLPRMQSKQVQLPPGTSAATRPSLGDGQHEVTRLLSSPPTALHLAHRMGPGDISEPVNNTVKAVQGLECFPLNTTSVTCLLFSRTAKRMGKCSVSEDENQGAHNEEDTRAQHGRLSHSHLP